MLRRFLLLCAWCPLSLFAQINTDRMTEVGKNALYMEDYALSIQYFNQVIYAKPYLYDPYFYRGLAKFYLEDFQGADNDLTQAIKINPFIQGTYQLRGLVRIRLNDFDGAIADYKKAISYAPDNQGFWQNMALCQMQKKDYKAATATIDEMLKKWPRFSKGYAMKADMALQQKDYKAAALWLEKTLELDPYEGSAWETKAFLSMNEKKYRNADREFSKALSMLPGSSNLYINRALARYRIFNYKGAMEDYTRALELDPSNYIAHYNRALLSMQVGEDNRAISDLDFLIEQDPGDMLAVYNRAVLREKTGNLRGAVNDYTRLINHFPSFWTGLMARASLKRRLGDAKGAEMDEFRVMKAQIDKSYNGKRYAVRHYNPNRPIPNTTRKKSSKNLEDYNKIVVDDDAEPEKHYDTAYTGKVQNRKASVALQPLFNLSYYAQGNGVRDAVNFYKGIEDINLRHALPRPLLITNYEPALDEGSLKKHQSEFDRLSTKINEGNAQPADYWARAMEAYTLRDFTHARADLDSVVAKDSTNYAALFMRASLVVELMEAGSYTSSLATQTTVSSSVKNRFGASVPALSQPQVPVSAAQSRQMALSLAEADLDAVIRLAPDFPYAYFNRAGIYAEQKEYAKAKADYDTALKLFPDFAEAYYNRGLVEIFAGHLTQGRSDLSKAGELGLYTAYSVIKHYSNAK